MSNLSEATIAELAAEDEPRCPCCGSAMMAMIDDELAEVTHCPECYGPPDCRICGFSMAWSAIDDCWICEDCGVGA